MNKKVIWKYEIEVSNDHVLDIPAHSELLYLGTQDDKIYLWVMLDPYTKGVKRHFRTVGTGHPIEENEDEKLMYVGSYQLLNGKFVGHVFEIF
jgi:hypothetical protein